jgi:phage shock protein PspC (stress-responsive transcriptional regulator)
MNGLLIGTLDILNKLVAVALIIVSTAKGVFGGYAEYVPFALDPTMMRVATTIVGFVVGMVGAAIVSGLLATLINISQEATLIRELLVARRTLPPP